MPDSTIVTFRAVGIYCYFPNLQVPVTPDKTVKEVQDVIAMMKPELSIIEAPDGTNLIGFGYDYTSGSVTPPNSNMASNGRRELNEHIVIQGVSTVWQYYRSAVYELEGQQIEVRAVTPGQPPYYETRLNEGIPTIPGGEIKSYNLTWRLVSIELTPEAFQRRYRRFRF